ncbi:hypothetical protein [Paenibacillus hamazuiensis]|uniref:hypothetical protein n=1 Tax=Paenibacillus hamazuiensis TaxID=2936508 RepID=UPI00200CF90B|nr:hypothetical protein [Paenibacillus hamazuiensis]
MNRTKRYAAAMMALALPAALIAGCGEANQPAPSAGQTGEGASKNAKKLDISISFFNIGKAFPDRNSDPFLKMIESRFNVNIVDKVISYADYKEKYQLWAASGDLPDVFSDDNINSEGYYSWIKQGIIRPLPSDLSKYPNVQKVLSLNDTKPLNVDGKYYMIPRQTYLEPDQWAIERAVVVRKDWLDKLGLKDPVTYDDYLNMYKSFAQKDPDGNGKNDTIGLTFRSTSSMLLPVAGGSFPHVINGSWVKENGKYIPYYASGQMKTVVKQLRQMYAEGAIDPDFAIMKPNDGYEKFGQGKVGAISVQATPNALSALRASWDKYVKDKKFEESVKILPVSWAAEDGSRYRYNAVTFWSESYFSSKVSDEKMDRILQIYDYLLSDEFMTFKRYGMEGKDYKKDGDKFTITREKNENGQYKSLGSMYPSYGGLFGALAAWGQQLELEDTETARINYGEQLWTLSHDALKYNVEKLKPVPTNFKVELLYTPAKSKLSAINATEDVIKVMLGKDDPVTMWDNIVKGYDSKGLQQAIKEVNDAVQQQGLDK